MGVLIENLQNNINVSDDILNLINKAAKLCLKNEGFEVPCEINILLVNDEEIRKINLEHRKIDKATDVLSFPMVDMIEGKIQSDIGDYDLDENAILLGDIVISMETAFRQSQEYEHSFERELAFLTTHGVFHLLGYDHMTNEQEKCMLERQEIVLSQMGLER